MKRLQQLCAGLILTFALSASAFAGQVDCPGVTASSQPTEVLPAGNVLANGVADSPQPQDNVIGKSTTMGAIPPAESNLANGFADVLLIMLSLI
jgi:hypothetical protein